MRQIVLAVALATGVFACASPGAEVESPRAENRSPDGAFDPRMIPVVTPGYTFAPEILRWFGEPHRIESLQGSFERWSYLSAEPVVEKDERDPTQRRVPAVIHDLVLRIGPDGVVDDVHYQRLEGTTRLD